MLNQIWIEERANLGVSNSLRAAAPAAKPVTETAHCLIVGHGSWRRPDFEGYDKSDLEPRRCPL